MVCGAMEYSSRSWNYAMIIERLPCSTNDGKASIMAIFWARILWILAAEDACSGWGSLWESSSFVPWFPTFVFRNAPGTVPECVRICGFRRNSSNLDRVPKMRDSVLLNSWDSFLVTLPSISSETFVIYSLLILGTDVFRDWPFLGCSSCVCLVTAANFRLFLNVAVFWTENAMQLWRLN